MVMLALKEVSSCGQYPLRDSRTDCAEYLMMSCQLSKVFSRSAKKSRNTWLNDCEMPSFNALIDKGKENKHGKAEIDVVAVKLVNI